MSGPAARGDVLIVGAGPTGLTLANALAACGIAATIIDRKAGPSADSKALALNVASQRGLAAIGLAGVVGAGGAAVRRIGVRWHGRRLCGVALGRAGGALLAQPQSRTEQELVAALAARGVDVQWRTTLSGVEALHGGAAALWRGPDGSQQRRRYGYIVGCDGKRSIVRSAMGARFSGTDYPMHFMLGDFLLDWDGAPDEASYHLYDDGFFILVPLGGQRWRVVVQQDGALLPGVAPDPARITGPVAARLGPGVFRSGPLWLSRAPFYQRCSDRLRSGHLLLAGDAAHLFSPIGGTGMNTGMQDALNLAWKLAYRLHGWGGDGLLDSYEQERMEAITANAAATDLSTRLIAGLERGAAAVAPWLPRMANRAAWRHRLPRQAAGLGAPSPRAFAAGCGDPVPGSPAAGDIWPGLAAWPDLVRACGSPPPQLVLARTDDSTVLAALAQLQRVRGAMVHVMVVAATAGTVHGLPVLAADDVRLQGHGPAPEALLLVRPDGTLGFSGAAGQVAALRAALCRQLGAEPGARAAA